MLSYLQNLLNARRRDDGASAVEYGLLIAAIAAVILAAVVIFGDFVGDLFQETCNEIDSNTTLPADAECT